MSKLSKMEKMERREMLGDLARARGEVFSMPECLMRGGITVVIVPALESARAKFVHVSVAVCSDADKFKRKRGELVALQRMMNDGEVIRVPRKGRTFLEIAEDVERLVTGY